MASTSQSEIAKARPIMDRDIRTMDAGEYITQRLKPAGMKKADLARKLNVSHGYVSNVTTGRSTPNPTEADKWAAALDLDNQQTELLRYLLARSKALRTQDSGAADYVHLIEQELDRIDGLARESVAAGLTLTATIRQLAELIHEFGLQVPETLQQALLKSEQTYELFAARLGMEEPETKSDP